MPSAPPRFRLRTGSREIEITGGNFVIGRSPECQIQLECGLVSRQHARLRETAEGLVIEDLGSRNGVLVNQRKITQPTTLAHGDSFSVGLTLFEVMDERLVKLPAYLSTLPPSSSPFAHSDVANDQQETQIVNVGGLSAREREVLELIVLGFTQKEMGERLHVSVKTIETHRARISEKLGCRTRAELVSYAITAGVLSADLARRVGS